MQGDALACVLNMDTGVWKRFSGNIINFSQIFSGYV